MPKKLWPLLFLLAFALPSFGQGIRVGDGYPILTTPRAGGPVSAGANATINFCNSPANAVPCTNKATTYTDITLGTACPTSTQLTLAGTNTCVATTDGYGNWGVWVGSGTYTFTITYPNGSSLGPYTLTLASSGGGGTSPFGGPRPWIDVTAPAYGAKGNGTGTFGNDDTAAIQNAINAACTAGGVSGTIPIVYFPPGVYLYSKQQTPSTLPDFLLPCTIEFQGAGYYPDLSFAVGFPIMSHGPVLFPNLGSSPNAAPVFVSQFPYNAYAGYPSGTFGGNFVSYNLNIVGYNQALYVTGSQQAVLRDTCLIQLGTTGPDATPLKITDTFEFYMDGGCLQSFGTTGQPVALFTGENQGGGSPTDVGDVFIRNITTTGGGFEYDQRTASVSSPPGSFNLQNIVMESPYGNSFNLICSNSNSYTFGGLTLDNVTQADNSVATASAVNVNCSGMTLSGLKVTHSSAGNGGNGHAATLTAGAITGYNVDDCLTECITGVVDGSGNPTGNGMQQAFSGGWDSVYDATDTLRLRTDFVGNGFASDSPSNRWFQKGNSFAGLGIDPQFGWLFGDSTNYGFNASLNETTTAQINVNFAALLPPTNVAGTAASGGSIASGTYTLVIRSSSNNCTTTSGPSIQSSAVTLSGSNHTINWTWTVPTGYVGTISNYCLTLGSAFSNQYTQVAGASTTNYSMTAAPSSGGTMPLTNPLQAQHIFTSSGLGINTTSPGPFNLDVQGSLGARFLNTATPNVSNSYGAPACLASVNCSSYIPISPVATDTFTRANSSASLGANWTVTNASAMGTLGISSNQAITESGSYSGISSWNGQSFGADQWSQVTVGVGPTTNTQVVGPTVRNGALNSNTLYWYECAWASGVGVRVIAKIVSGTATTLATTGASACTTGDLLRLEVVGNQLTAFYNGAFDGTVSDSSIASGSPGIGIFSNTTSPSATNWVGGNLEGNEGTDIFNRPNFWNQNQTFNQNLLVLGLTEGRVPVVKTTTASATLPAYSQFSFNQEATAATAITYTLPTAAQGNQQCFGNGNNGSAADTGTVTLQTSASGQFVDYNGTLSASGGYIISGGAAGDKACVVGIDATHWEFYPQVGTWTLH